MNDMELLKSNLFKEIELISNRHLVGEDLIREIDRSKMVNDLAKTIITASIAEARIFESNGFPPKHTDQNRSNSEKLIFHGGKRDRLLRDAR